MKTVRALAPLLFLSVCTPVFPSVITLDFERFSDAESVTTQFPGLTFTNTITLQASISLNEFEFPPRSGQMVISDDGGPIEISFASPIRSFAGYFTYLTPLTLTAFDVNNTSVASVPSAFSSNLLLSGDLGSSPNELLSLSATGGMIRLVISGDALGESFTLDDLSYEPSAVIPEPCTLLITLITLATLVGLRRDTNT